MTKIDVIFCVFLWIDFCKKWCYYYVKT